MGSPRPAGPAALPETGWSRGISQPRLREFTEYWRTGYDWRARETVLQSLPPGLRSVRR
ncbi:epoxide hydrolase N-terminal domain-containing protein [Spirillospora sp. NPDC047418]